ncbi:heme exporter protein CcmD [Pseudooceanicola nanhaiensis]|uniref:heme exporter protein CcmD n=1 Tax=Pseudooceanicola nanhaiensis TaxID=375761 RepID=UPI001CD2780E|nr:heme exporter protein CcmD [Pseudooceanicola nanhaiensis]MCA0919672.1 heme exporter protein CcmD [Pseudooceanicola nanhaiensis]
MMPDLGKYAGAVLSAYGASLGLIVVLVAASLWRARRVKAQLAAVEARRSEGTPQ